MEALEATLGDEHALGHHQPLSDDAIALRAMDLMAQSSAHRERLLTYGHAVSKS